MHAYLIIAHNEFDILQQLVYALDDERNDIYIHYDKKIKNIPFIKTHKSTLFVCTHRIDVRWGDYSMIKAEFVLWEEAYNKKEYLYYHIISGVHYPLKSQDFLHGFFCSTYDKSVLMEMETNKDEYISKLGRFNFCTKTYAHSSLKIRLLSQFIWKIGIKIQKICKYYRSLSGDYKKASVWVSLTGESVAYLLSKKNDILRKYKYTFCGDEYFVLSELWNSSLKDKILFYDKLLKCNFIRANTKVYTITDFDSLMNSDCLFARKFSSKDLGVVQKIKDVLLCGNK